MRRNNQAVRLLRRTFDVLPLIAPCERMIQQAARQLISVAADNAAGQADVQSAAQKLFDAAGASSAAEVQEAMRLLAEAFSEERLRLSRAGFLALVGGALVENGHDPAPLFEPLFRKLHSLFESANRLAQTCIARMPQPKNEDQGKADDKQEDPQEIFERLRQEAAMDMPAENAAWEALKVFWRPAIAVCSVSPSARAAGRGLTPVAEELADYHEAGHWLSLMLSVLDDEPLLVIEPSARTGILARMSGVVDNFQLQMLLMDQFPQAGFLARRRISRQAAEIARGDGPQQIDETVQGAWNLYTCEAASPDGRLPDRNNYGNSRMWVWGEGTPADIPVFEGRRVVLLGPASYDRSWGCQRTFAGLRADLKIEKTLTPAEVADWLRRMAAANTTKSKARPSTN